MKRRINRQGLVGVALFFLIASNHIYCSDKLPVLDRIEIMFKFHPKKTIVPENFELSYEPDDLQDAEFISIYLKSSSKYEVRVRQQSENSIVLYDDLTGVLPLLDWKHGYSSWVELIQVEDGRFQVQEHQTGIFPDVTKNDLADAIQFHFDGNRHQYADNSEFKAALAWAQKAAEGCSPVSKCAQGSKKIFLIEVKIGQRWKTLHKLFISSNFNC